MEEKFEMNFTLAELNVILAGCQELPYKQSNGVITSIHKQYESSIKKRELEAKKITENKTASVTKK